MKSKHARQWGRSVRTVAGVILVGLAGVALWQLTRTWRDGGSSVTNPNAFMSAGVAEGLRAASR